MKSDGKINYFCYNAIYGPISDLFIAANERIILVEDSSNTDEGSEFNSFVSHVDGPRWKFCKEPGVSSRGNMLKSIPASGLLRKLWWSTLGLQFDWSKVIANFILFFFSFYLKLSTMAFISFNTSNPFGP